LLSNQTLEKTLLVGSACSMKAEVNAAPLLSVPLTTRHSGPKSGPVTLLPELANDQTPRKF
jgi:hypothetical protein